MGMRSYADRFKVIILSIGIGLSVFSTIPVNAQIFLLNEMPRGMYYERTARIKKFKDMKDFRDVFHNDKFMLGDNILSGSISHNTGRVIIDDGISRGKEFRHQMGFFTRLRVVEEFYINTTFYKEFNKSANLPWISDFTYTVGRYNWRPRTWSYGYENYEPNKYTDNIKTLGEKLLRGSFFITYNYVPPRLRDIKFRRSKTDSTLITMDSLAIVKKLSRLKISYFTKYALKWRDFKEVTHGGTFYTGKPSGGISARYTIISNFYAEIGTNFYLIPSQKQPWDPDFTYGFGYFDYRAFRLSFTYGSYAVNRFPWNGPKQFDDYGFWDGNFRFNVNYIW